MSGEGKVTKSAQRSVGQTKQSEPSVAQRSSAKRRAVYIERMILVAIAAAVLAAGLYLALYFQTGAWQILADVGAVGLGLVCLIRARWLIRRMEFDAAGYWTLGAVTIVFGGGELFWAGTTVYFTVVVLLLMVVVASLIRPRKWYIWLGVAGLYVIYVLLVNWLEPLPRYEVLESSVLRIAAPGITLLLVLGVLWQLARAYQRINTIRARLLIAFVTMALLPAIAIAIVSGVGGFLGGRQQVYSQLESVATLKEAEVETWVNSLKSDLVIALSGQTVMQHVQMLLEEEPADAEDYQEAYTELRARFQQIAKPTGQFDELFFMDLQGQVVLSTDTSQEGDIYGYLPFFQEGLKGEHVYPPFKHTALDQVSVFAVRPIKDEQGRVLGVMAGRASMARLSEIMLERAGLGTTGETYLVRANYTMLTESRFVAEENIYVRTEGVDAAVGTRGNGYGMYADYRDVPIIGVYHWLPDLQAVLVAEQDQSEAFGATYRTLAINAGVALVSALVAVVGALFVTRSIANPLADLAGIAAQIAGGDLARIAKMERKDEIGALAQAFNSMTAQLRELIGSLEQRVAARTRALAYRSIQLETAAQVSEAAGSLLDPRELERQVVELIREHFDYYYVGLFLADEDGQWTGEPGRWAVLRAGTGQAGQAMLEAGHKLGVGGESMIGRCVAEGQARIALDVGEEAARFDNPLLPETRSEMALPLMSRGQVIGALSVQSEREAAFSDEDISILQTMAAQVANAIANARLYTQLRESEERYRTILDDIEDGYYEVDIAGNMTFFNDSLCKLFGYARDELMGMNNRQYTDEETVKVVYQTFNEVYRTGEPARALAWEFIRKDGTRIFVETSTSLIRSSTGEPVGFRGIIRDISERERLLSDLERHALQLQTATEVSHAASSILDVDQLLATSVNLIHDRFNLYYVGLFLVDEPGEFAVLRAGTGEAGHRMLAQGHRLAIEEDSMIGWCVANAEARIDLDVGKNAVHFINPLLPDTRSEMVLPLLSRGQVIGAMTIQSKEEAAFSEADISALRTMADQLANAIANAQQFGLTERARAETDKRVRELDCLNDIGQRMSASLPVPELLAWVAERIPQAMQYPSHCVVAIEHQGETFGVSEAKTLLRQMVQSLQASNGAVGRVYVAYTVEEHDFLDKESALLGDIARRLSSYIESRGLFQETQANLQEITRLHRRYLQEQWQEFLAEEETRQHAGYLFDQREVQPAGDLWRPEIGMAVARGRTLALTVEAEEWGSDGDGDARAALVVPLQLRDQIIGALDFFETDRDRRWSADDIALVEAVADQVALAVENARAYQELQRTAEELREMDTLKSQFLANMSHELRTPLNSIIGFSRVMLKGIDGPLTDLQQADLTSIYNNGQHLLGLINDILDYSRIEAGKMELVFEPVDLRPIIDGVMSTAIGLVKDRPVKLIKEVADDLPAIRADSTRVRQVLLNLVSNAAKFTEEGSITLRALADDEQVTISVTDTGVGIPEDFLEKVFQEFQQVDGSATRRVGGTGLGLPISRHFVEMHGGQIWVESEVGVGSTFTFAIPIHGPGYVEDPALSALEIDPDCQLVLAVEDSDEMIAFYQRYLGKHGYQVVQVPESNRASLWVRELSPFAVLLDVLLPDADGWEVLEELKTSRETAHVPVIVCSIVDEKARGLSMGAAAHLTKPVLEDDLLQAMALAAKLQSK